MIQTGAALRVVSPAKEDDEEPLTRDEIRERVELLTVREGTCTERWGSWGTGTIFKKRREWDRHDLS